MMNVSADPAPGEGARFEAMRHAMVASQLRTSGVNDPRVVEAMSLVRRENHLPAADRLLAYRDRLVPLGEGRAMNTPLATGLLLTQAQVRDEDHVLLIGAAGGYTAALLARLARSVVAVEQSDALVALARATLAGERKAAVVQGPLGAGWQAQAPYDLLVIDGAVEQLPDTLIAQLKPGGRIVAGVLDRGVARLAAGQRSASGGFALVPFADCECAVLPGFGIPKTFRF